MIDSVIIATNLLLYVTAFILGYTIGRIRQNVDGQLTETSGVFFKPEAKQKKLVKIDEKKFVTEVSADTLQKKGKDLGTNVVIEDNVNSAVSKLTLLKKK